MLVIEVPATFKHKGVQWGRKVTLELLAKKPNLHLVVMHSGSTGHESFYFEDNLELFKQSDWPACVGSALYPECVIYKEDMRKAMLYFEECLKNECESNED